MDIQNVAVLGAFAPDNTLPTHHFYVPRRITLKTAARVLYQSPLHECADIPMDILSSVLLGIASWGIVVFAQVPAPPTHTTHLYFGRAT